MREKKYSNIEEAYEEKENNIENVIALLNETKELSEKSFEETPSQKEDEDEADKLSLTREIKFKDLQEQIENDEKAATREIVLEPKITKSPSKKEKADPTSEEPKTVTKKGKKTTRKNKEVEKPIINENNDDSVTITKIDLKKLNELEDVDIDKDLEKTLNEELYLTTSFKPAKKRVKKIFKQIFAFIIILGIIAALIYIVVLPTFKKYNLTSKDIYIKNIDNLTNRLNNINFASLKMDGNINELSFTLDTNNDDLKTLKPYQLVSKIEQDQKNDTTILNANIVKDKKKAGLTYYNIEDELYLNITNSDRIVNLNKKEHDKLIDIFDSYNKSITEIKNNINLDDEIYLITKYIESYKSIIDDNNITKHKEKLTVENKEVSVTRYTHELNKEQIIALDELIYETIINDDKCLNILSTIYDKKDSELKEELKQKYLNNNYEDGYIIKINIYVKNMDDLVGIDIEENGFRVLYYYTADNYFDFLIDASKAIKQNIDIEENDKTNNVPKKIYRITKSIENNRNRVIIEHNGQQVIKLYFDTLTANDIIGDYELNINDYIFTGKLELHLNDNVLNFDISTNYQEYYYHFIGQLKNSSSKNITSIDKNAVVKETEDITTDEYNLLLESLDDMDIDVEALSRFLYGEEENVGQLEYEDEESTLKQETVEDDVTLDEDEND